MTDLTPVAALDPVVQIETTTLVLAGAGQPANQQAQALLNRDAYRGQQIAQNAAASLKVLGDYALGLVFTEQNQAFRYLDDLYVPTAGMLPYTTDGSGAAEIALFHNIGSAVLRQDLLNEDDAAKNSGLVFFDEALPYATGSIGAAVKAVIEGGLLSATWESVKKYGVTLDGVTDDTLGMQDAFDDALANGVTLWVPAGSLLVTQPLTYDTTGLGFYRGLRMFGAGQKSAMFINAINNAGAGGPVIRLTSGASTNDQQHGGFLSGMGFVQDGAGTDGHGIEYRGCWFQRFENLSFEELTGSAIRPINTAQDADSSVQVEFNYIRAIGCIGPSFNSTGGTGGLSIHSLRNWYSINCGQGDAHIVIDGCIHFEMDQFSIAGATGAANYTTNQVAVRLKTALISSKNIDIGCGEIGNSLEKGIVLAAVQNIRIGGFRFVKRAGETTFTTGIEVPDGALGLCNGVDIQPINLQIDHATPAFTFLKIGNGINERFTVRAPVSTNFFAGSIYATLDDTARARIGYLEDISGRVLFSRASAVINVPIAVAGATTLDLLNGSAQRLNISAVGAHTINAPIGNTGQAMDLMILNNSGGAITVTFAGFTGVSGYTDPATGSATSARFLRDQFSGAWRQIGGWS